MTIQSAVAMCSACGWKNEITVDEAFRGNAERSARQACRGHAGNGCEYEDTDVDVIHG